MTRITKIAADWALHILGGVVGIRFTATPLTLEHRPIVRLPADASAQLPSRGQVAVTGTLDGTPFRTVLEPDGLKGHWLQVPDGTGGGVITVELEPTKVWPEPSIPADFQAALDDAPDLIEAWQDITSMARWEWVRWVNATKNPATRAKRIEVSISKLRNGSRRPCCFDLSSCTDPELAKNGKLIFDHPIRDSEGFDSYSAAPEL